MALSAMASKTVRTSVCDRLTTRRISLVAVCRSSASLSSPPLEQLHVLDGNHRLIGEGLEERDLVVGEWSGLAPGDKRPPRWCARPVAAGRTSRSASRAARAASWVAPVRPASASVSSVTTTHPSRMARPEFVARRGGLG